MLRLFRSFYRSRRATSAVEFGLIIPVLLVFVGGIVEMGRAWQTYVAVNRLATRYAIAWADCSDSPVGACATEMALYATAAAEQNIAPQLIPVSGISLRMMQVNLSSTGAATVSYATPSGITPTAAELAVAQSAIANGQTGVIVTVTYIYTPQFFAAIAKPFLGTGKTFTYTAAQLKA